MGLSLLVKQFGEQSYLVVGNLGLLSEEAWRSQSSGLRFAGERLCIRGLGSIVSMPAGLISKAFGTSEEHIKETA